MIVAIHNKNGQGLLPLVNELTADELAVVAIHNKNGQGLLPKPQNPKTPKPQVAIHNKNGQGLLPNPKGSGKQIDNVVSQSTIKMDKGYYSPLFFSLLLIMFKVAIHNKNGQGLLLR